MTLVSVGSADDITFQRGRLFSIYSPGSCQRLERAKFELVLDCNFRGKNAQFYLKEFPPFPAQYVRAFEPWKNEPPKRCNEADLYVQTATEAVFDDLQPSGMMHRMEFFSNGCIAGTEWGALFAKQGFIYANEEARRKRIADKCVFIRVLSNRHGRLAVLLAIAEAGILVKEGPVRCDVPVEVRTIMTSLDMMGRRLFFD